MNNDLFVKMAINNWQGEIDAANKLLDELSDENLALEIAPGRNRGIYLLGHLTAIHDMMLPLLRFQQSTYPELQPIFVDAPDKTADAIPAAKQLRQQWKEVNDLLLQYIKALPADEWFTRHASISEGDFPKEPHRNRLNVLLNRTNHAGYHRGQLALLKKK